MDNINKIMVDLSRVKREPSSQSTEPKINQEIDYEKCSICWSEPPINAIKLTCGHTFCFLCIKAVATTTNRCAYCRANIDINLERDPIRVIGNIKLPRSFEDGQFWFYEGKRGWWFYDADSNQEIEQAYQNGLEYLEKTIAGQIYVINFHNNCQYLKQDQTRSRRIVRSTPNDSVQGVAGMRDKELMNCIRNNAPIWGDQSVSNDEDLRF